MNNAATVTTTDLEAALSYLEGLADILRSFHQDQRGRHESDELLAKLQALRGPGLSWEPLRYQVGVGQGWQFIAENVDGLRARLKASYLQARP